MCPSADRTQSREDNNVTTRMSNIIPQASQNNQGLWANFEGYCRTNLATNNNEVLLISGPANFTGQRLTNQMAVPGSVWKIAVVVTNADSTVPASLRIKANSRVMAINTPNRNTGLGTWQSYLTSVKEIEGITGFNFFSDVDPALATYLKRVVDTGTGPNQPTVITSFSPTSGAAGTTVTIAGYNFGTNPTVRFNGVSASATVSGGTNITAVVPAGAGTGPISVATSSGGTDNSTNSFTFTTSVSPSLTLSLTNLSGFATTWPSASPSQNYLLTGAGLTGNVTVTAPTNFEISLNNTNFASTQSLAPTSGNLSNTVYVRLTASAPAGPVSGVVAHAGGGAASQNLEVSGTVAKATPSLSWSNPTSISYGTVLSATQLNATSSVAGTFSYNPTNGSLLNAGTNTLAAIFRATDSNNYISPVTNTVSLVVTKATPIISNLPTATAITLGQALSNSVLSGGIASVPGVFAFSAPATVPNATGSQAVVFTPNDLSNFNPVNTSVTVTVNAASATLSFGNLNQTYDGTARVVTVTTTPAGLSNTVTYNGSVATPTNAGNYTVIATVTEPGYSASATNILTVAQALPGIIWSNPTSISYGTVLSATQLNATSSVAGTFSYNPTNGSLLNAGTNTLAAIFRATDSNNYISPVTNTVSLVVTKATPIISNLPTATAITLGQALSNSVLSGGIASVPGNFAFTVPAMVPGATGSQGVTFTPTESGNYNPVTNNVTVVVNALPSSLTLSPATLGIFSATTGTASTNQSYLLSGVGLTNSLNVSTSPGFEISLTNGSGYGSSLDLIPSGGNLGTNTIYVRMASTNAPGVINGTISHNGGGINNQTITLTGVVFATNAAVPITLAKWTFENLSPGTNISSSYGPFSPEEGNHTNLAQFSGFGLHVSTNTAFSRPTGNGSRQSLSCNNWTTNDYFQFTLSSSGYKSLKLKFDQYSSSRGPSQFNLDYSTNGVVFSTYTNYSVPLISSPGFWTNTTVDSRSTLIFDMTSVGEINNKTNLTFRLVQRTTADMSGTSVTSSGTSRVDNVEFSATPLAINYPVLILFGGPTTHITVGGGWSDPGVSALDAEDGNLAVVTNGAVNPNVLGSYLLAYTATDSAGNSSTTNRTVNVLLNSFNSVAADSDENGIPDLVEYALGGLPTGNPISILPSPVTVGTNLRITFLARTNDSSLLIRPVASTNLSDSYSWNTNGVVKTTGVATNNGFELQTWETPVSGAVRKFLKINITR